MIPICALILIWLLLFIQLVLDPPRPEPVWTVITELKGDIEWPALKGTTLEPVSFDVRFDTIDEWIPRDKEEE